jgi:hypothetical protein
MKHSPEGGIFEPQRDEVIGGLRRRHSEELYDLYSSPNIIRIIMSRRMRWAGHVENWREACIEGCRRKT